MASFPGLPLPPPVRKAVVRAVVYYTSVSAPDIPSSFLPYLSATVPYITSLEVANSTLPHTFSIVTTARTIIEHVNSWCTRNSISREAYLNEAVRRRPDQLQQIALESTTTHVETALEVYDPHASNLTTLEPSDPHVRPHTALEGAKPHAERTVSRLASPVRLIEEIDHEGDLLLEEAHDGTTVTPLKVKPLESALVHTPVPGPSSAIATKPSLNVSTHIPAAFRYRNPTVANESSDEAEADTDSPEAPAYKTAWNITDLLADKLGTATIVDSAIPATDKEVTMYNPDSAEGALERRASDASSEKPDPEQPRIESGKGQTKQIKGKDHRRDSRDAGLFGGLFGRGKTVTAGPSTTKQFPPDAGPKATTHQPSQVAQQSYTPLEHGHYGSDTWQNPPNTPRGQVMQEHFEPEMSRASYTPRFPENPSALQNPPGPQTQRSQLQDPARSQFYQNTPHYGPPASRYDWDYEAMETRMEERFEQRMEQRMQAFTRTMQEALRQMMPTHAMATPHPPVPAAPPAPPAPPAFQLAASRTHLKPDMVGYFEPKNMEDYRSAYNFVDAIDTTVTFEGDAATAAVLQRCLKGECAVNWRSSLSDEDKVAMRASTVAWKRCIIRDFYPRPGVLLVKANREVFRWNQNRSPLEYVTEKLRLLRLAGIRDENHLVEEVHNGFSETPELFSSLENCIQAASNSVSKYRNDVSRHQEAAKATYALRGNRFQSAFPFKRPDAEKKPDTNSGSKSQFVKPDSTDAKAAKRSRPCRWCKGEHWDKECTQRPSNSSSTPRVRGYYAHLGII